MATTLPPVVPLGGSGLEVSPLGFGCMGITAFYGEPMEDAKAVELLQAVYDMGYRHFDTAEVYKTDTKHNEEQLAQFLKTVPRESYTIATKFFPMREGPYDLACVEKAVDDSLARLGLDYVDLYYCHRPPKEWELAEQWMLSMKEIVAKGKVKHVGLSEFSPEWTRKLHAIHPVACIQLEWSLLTRNLVEEIVLDCCKELKIGVVAYSPLARNMLAALPTEPPTDWRSSVPRFSAENLAKNKEMLAKIEEMGNKREATAAQLSLAWLYHKAPALGLSMIAIPGTTKIANAKTNLDSLQLKLSEEEVAQLEELAAMVAGERGSESYKDRGLEGSLQQASGDPSLTRK